MSEKLKISGFVLGILLSTYFAMDLASDPSQPTESSYSIQRPTNEVSINTFRGPNKRPIESIRVGDRVLAENPEMVRDSEGPEISDASMWRKLTLQLDKDLYPESLIDLPATTTIETLRPIEEIGELSVGDWVFVNQPEMSAIGFAIVRAVEPAPSIQPGEGEIVTSTYRHTNSTVLDVRFEGESSSIGVTESHPFWSPELMKFVPIGKLNVGDVVQTFYGETKRIASKQPRPAPHDVFNIEVNNQHVYFVGEQGLLVHNMSNFEDDGLAGGGVHGNGLGDIGRLVDESRASVAPRGVASSTRALTVGAKVRLRIKASRYTAAEREMLEVAIGWTNVRIAGGAETAIVGQKIPFSSYKSRKFVRDLMFPDKPVSKVKVGDASEQLGFSVNIDEIVPRQIGGRQVFENQRILHQRLNLALGPIEERALRNLPDGMKVQGFHIEWY